MTEEDSSMDVSQSRSAEMDDSAASATEVQTSDSSPTAANVIHHKCFI